LVPVTFVSLSKALCVPSGDHAGAESKEPSSSNSVRRPVPSALIDWIARSVSPIGDVVVANEILVMSGE